LLIPIFYLAANTLKAEAVQPALLTAHITWV